MTENETRGWALDRMHTSRQSLDRLQYVFALCDPVTLTFDISTQNHATCRISQGHSLYQKFDTLGSFIFIVRADRHTDRLDTRTHRQTRMNALLPRLSYNEEEITRTPKPSHECRDQLHNGVRSCWTKQSIYWEQAGGADDYLCIHED